MVMSMLTQQVMPASLDRETECLAASVYFESKSEPLEAISIRA